VQNVSIGKKSAEENVVSTRRKQKEQHNVGVRYLCTGTKNVKIKSNDKL
jgi:hypothetical protein